MSVTYMVASRPRVSVYEEAPRDGLAAAMAVAAMFAAMALAAHATLSPLLPHQPPETGVRLVWLALAAAAVMLLALIPLHELLHAVAARLLGSRVAVRFLPRYLGITVPFLDPLPLRRAALVYLAPLLATPLASALVALLLQALQIPSPPIPHIALVWLAAWASDAVTLLQLLALGSREVFCTPDGRTMILCQPACAREREVYVRLMLKEVLVFVAVASLLLLAFFLPPDVKRSLEATATSHPATWLTSNYVHEDWDHLLGNLEGYSACVSIYIALIPVLGVLGFDHRWVKRFSVVTHLGALVAIPIISTLTWLQFARSRAPQIPALGFSSSVAAYFGEYAALWAVATAEAFGVGKGWRAIYIELQLLLLLLTPASRYSTRLAPWLAPAAYMPFISVALAALLAVRSPRSLRAFFERIPPRARGRREARIALLALLLLPYSLFTPFMLDSLYPASAVIPGTGEVVNLVAHLVGMVLGYALTCLYVALARAAAVSP